MMMPPSPRRSLVTGASHPFGLAMVRQCLARGDQVIAASRNPARVSQLADLRASYGGLELVALDPADASSVADAIPIIERLTDSIDLLVLGHAEHGSHERAGDRARDEHFDTLSATGVLERIRRHAVAPLLLVRALLPLLVAGDAARVLVIGDSLAMSTSAETANGSNGGAGYAEVAGATTLHALMRLLARDLGEHRIPVCIGNPGHYTSESDDPLFNAPLDEAAAGLLGVTDRLPLVRSGRFFDWTGAERT